MDMDGTPSQVLDELLVLHSQEGDADAFAALVRRYQPRLRRHAWHLTGHAEAADDAVQEAWLAVARGLRRLEDPACFRRWLYQIVTRKCADWVRARQRERRLTALRAAQPATVSAEHDETLGRLQAAMRQLPGERRALLALCYLDGLSIEEIAQVLEIPAGTVKSRLHHARQELKEILERSGT
jgi:RNA polymerase sigma-70 factor (ECF subfamily)